MNLNIQKWLIRITALCLMAFLNACSKEAEETLPTADVRVGFVVDKEDSRTRTSLDASSGLFSWEESDKVSLWAKDAGGEFVLNAQEFSVSALGYGTGQAYFTSTIAAPMAEGDYSYFICYPLPTSVQDNNLTFMLDAVQDGKAGNGSGICLSGWTAGPALPRVDISAPLGESAMPRAGMHHILHYLKFYIPQGCNLLGEEIESLEFTMPQAVAGTVTVDLTDGSASLSDAVSTVSIEPQSPFGEESYVSAAIYPPSVAYGEHDVMNVSLYSANHYSDLTPIILNGRTFPAGHITGVPLRPYEIKDYFSLTFTLAGNNLGQDVQKLTLTLPEGVNWPDSGSNVLEYADADGSLFLVGESFRLSTRSRSAFSALSGQSVSVSYESADAIVSETLILPDLSTAVSAGAELHCPYLLFEDFSGIVSFNSGDKHSASNLGDKSPYTFGDGWSVARAGGSEGKAVRMAAHREWMATYDSRCDSAPLRGIKDGSSVDVVLTFNYSMNREEGGLGSAPKLGATVHVGWNDNLDGISSGNTSGTFVESFHVNENTGSYDNIDKEHSTAIPGMTNARRISWREVADGTSGTSNGTYWLYLDNVRVSIAKQ